MQEVSYTIATEEMPYMESTNSSPYTHPAKWRDRSVARVPQHSHLIYSLSLI